MVFLKLKNVRRWQGEWNIKIAQLLPKLPAFLSKKGMTEANSALDANKSAFPFMKINWKYIFIQTLVKLLEKPLF